MSNMERPEVIALLDTSLKRAASKARELAKLEHNTNLIKIAISIESIRENILYLAHAKSRSKAQLDKDIERQVALLNPNPSVH